MTRAIIGIVGPSCAGKSTLERALAATGQADKAVSTTTRPPREGERDGVDYHFVDDVHFENLRLSGQLVEWVQFNGQKYGLTAAELEHAASPYVVVVAEPHGIGQIHGWCRTRRLPFVLVYMDNDPLTLIERLLRRLTKQPARLSEYARRTWSLLADEIAWRGRPEIAEHIDLMIDGRHEIPPEVLADMALTVAREKHDGKVVRLCRTTPDQGLEGL